MRMFACECTLYLSLIHLLLFYLHVPYYMYVLPFNSWLSITRTLCSMFYIDFKVYICKILAIFISVKCPVHNSMYDIQNYSHSTWSYWRPLIQTVHENLGYMHTDCSHFASSCSFQFIQCFGKCSVRLCLSNNLKNELDGGSGLVSGCHSLAVLHDMKSSLKICSSQGWHHPGDTKVRLSCLCHNNSFLGESIWTVMARIAVAVYRHNFFDLSLTKNELMIPVKLIDADVVTCVCLVFLMLSRASVYCCLVVTC